MKKFAYIVILLLWVLVSPVFSASKLSPNEHQYLSVWGQAGYATMLNNAPDVVKPGPGVSPALGIGYRYFRNGFIVQTGLEGQYCYLTNKVNNADIHLPMTDTEGDPFVMNANLKKCDDITHGVFVNVPVLVGYAYRHFYFLGGANVGVGVYGAARTIATLKTTATYEWALEPLEDIPDLRIYNNQPANSAVYKVKWKNPSVNLHLEVGGRVDRFLVDRGGEIPVKKYRVYVALFADYGLLNVHNKSSVGQTLSYRQPEGQPIQFEVVPSMVSKQMLDAKVNPVVVGVKATFVWELPEEPICIICDN